MASNAPSSESASPPTLDPTIPSDTTAIECPGSPVRARRAKAADVLVPSCPAPTTNESIALPSSGVKPRRSPPRKAIPRNAPRPVGKRTKTELVPSRSRVLSRDALLELDAVKWLIETGRAKGSVDREDLRTAFLDGQLGKPHLDGVLSVLRANGIQLARTATPPPRELGGCGDSWLFTDRVTDRVTEGHGEGCAYRGCSRPRRCDPDRTPRCAAGGGSPLDPTCRVSLEACERLRRECVEHGVGHASALRFERGRTRCELGLLGLVESRGRSRSCVPARDGTGLAPHARGRGRDRPADRARGRCPSLGPDRESVFAPADGGAGGGDPRRARSRSRRSSIWSRTATST